MAVAALSLAASRAGRDSCSVPAREPAAPSGAPAAPHQDWPVGEWKLRRLSSTWCSGCAVFGVVVACCHTVHRLCSGSRSGFRSPGRSWCCRALDTVWSGSNARRLGASGGNPGRGLVGRCNTRRRRRRAGVSSAGLGTPGCIGTGLRGNRGQPFGENVSRANRSQLFGVGHLLGDLGHDQHFLNLIETRGRNDTNVEEQIFAGFDRRNLADRQALGEDAIATAGEHLFAGFHLLVTHDVLQRRHSVLRALDDALQARVLQYCSDAAELIIDGQHLRRSREHLDDLADDAGWGDDRHVGLDAVFRALVDVEYARLLAAAGADDLRRHRALDVLLLELQQCLDPACHARVFAEPRVVDLHALDLRAQLAILPANPAEIDVVCPGVLHPFLRVHHGAFNGCYCGDRPQTDETGFAHLRRAAHLHRQPNDLGEQNGRQHDQVLVAA